MKLNQILAERRQELIEEIESLEKVEQSLADARAELESIDLAVEVIEQKQLMLAPAKEEKKTDVDVSDLTLMRQEFESKYGNL